MHPSGIRGKKTTVRDSLRVSFKDGVFAAAMLGVTDYYVIPLALVLGATVQQVGLVGGVPGLFGSISQLFATDAVERIGGRLKLIVRAVSFQAGALVAISSLAWIEFPYRVECLILLLVFFSISGALAGPAWGSLMTDYIPKGKRGSYFGWRNRMLGLVNVASMTAAGTFLYYDKGLSALAGFSVIFLIAAGCRFISASYIAKMREVPRKRDPASEFSFVMFLTRFRESNFVKFVAFVSALTFASYLASPFFAVFMLRDLRLSYLTYMLLQLAATAAGFVALPLWGRHGDLVGNVRVLRLAGFLTTLIPFLWLVSRSLFYLVLLQLYAGFAWSGVTLCASNFIYDAVTPPKRVRCIGYFNVINGTALFLGALAGGYLASRVPSIGGSPILGLFTLSSICRVLCYFLLFRTFREVREAQVVSLQELFFSVVGVRPLIGASGDRAEP